MIEGAIIGAIAGLIAVILGRIIRHFRTRGKAAPSPAPAPPPVNSAATADLSARSPRQSPVLRGISGFYAGASLELGDGALTIGRDSRAANLVFPPDFTPVSERHCRVTARASQFEIEDCWSTNGTYLASGERLAPGKPHALRAGDRFFLADGSNVFEVNWE